VRVVFLTHNYPRFPGDVAGAFLHPLARALVAIGHDVRVVAPSESGAGGRSALDDIPVRRVRYANARRERYAYTGTLQTALRSAGGLIALGGLWRAMRQGARAEAGARDTVVHAHWWVPAGLAAPPELPLVVTIHGTDGMLLRRSAMARHLARPVLRRARVVTAVSHALAATVAGASGRPIPAERVQPMPIDAGTWSWSRGGGGVLVVARLTPQKRVGLVLAAVARLAREGREIRCTVIGDGPERAHLEAQARASAIAGQIRFTGALPFDQVRGLLETADLAVQAGRDEGFGLAAAEALMTGVPVVACRDGGGLLDIVPPDGAGRVVPPDEARLATAIAEVLDAPAAAASARETGAAWRLRLSPATVAAGFSRWYHEALGA
jgi:glycosyltransferase involved in cell wall biosynthesis